MPDIERELRGLDVERPLPPALYERLETALLDEADGIGAEVFEGLDAPRPMPPKVRAAVEDVLIRTAPTDRRARVFLASAAAVLLIVGAVAALRAGTPSQNRSVASGPVRSVPAAGVPPVLEAPTTAAGASAAAAGGSEAAPHPATTAVRSTTTTTWNCGLCARNGAARATGAAAGPATTGAGQPLPVAAVMGPHVESVDPSSGTRRGGTIVTLRGSGFTGANGVRFGSSSAVDFTVVSDTEIRVMTPPSPSAQRVPVSVTYADGTATPTSDNGPFFSYT